MVGSFGAEVSLPVAAYDTIIIANTIEHCQNAMIILQNIWNSLRSGGYLVFGEEFSHPRAHTDLCHPLRVSSKFYLMWLNVTFQGGIKLLAACGHRIGGVLCDSAPRDVLHKSSISNTVYAIAQKN